MLAKNIRVTQSGLHRLAIHVPYYFEINICVFLFTRKGFCTSRLLYKICRDSLYKNERQYQKVIKFCIQRVLCIFCLEYNFVSKYYVSYIINYNYLTVS